MRKKDALLELTNRSEPAAAACANVVQMHRSFNVIEMDELVVACPTSKFALKNTRKVSISVNPI